MTATREESKHEALKIEQRPFNQSFKLTDGQLTLSGISITLPQRIEFLCPSEPNQFICLCKDQIIRIFDVKSVSFIAESEKVPITKDIENVKLLYVPQREIIVFGPDQDTLSYHPTKLTLSPFRAMRAARFSTLECLTPNRLIGKRLDYESNKLVVYTPDFATPVTKLKIKNTTLWTVINGTLIKVLTDKSDKIKIKLFDYKENAFVKKSQELSIKDGLQQDMRNYFYMQHIPRSNIIILSIFRNLSESRTTHMLNLKNNTIQSHEDTLTILKLPESDTYLCRPVDTKKDFIYLDKSNKKHILPKSRFHFDLVFSSTSAGTITYHRATNTMVVIKSSHVLALEEKKQEKTSAKQSQSRFAFLRAPSERKEAVSTSQTYVKKLESRP